MVEVKIVTTGDSLPKVDDDYVQVITRKEQEGNPGNFVSDIEHFSLEIDAPQKSMSRQTRNIGFNDTIDSAKRYAEDHDVPVVYATDHTART